MLKIFSIFNSVSGEIGGVPQGSFMTFIRLAGCNLRCSYCDTEKALSIGSGSLFSLDEVLDAVQELGCWNILITGGEPLVQGEGLQELIYALKKRGYSVSIETNGSMPFILQGVDYWIVDYKSTSSGMSNHMLPIEFFKNLKSGSVIKFVCSNKDDVLESIDTAKQLPDTLIKSISADFDNFTHAELIKIIQDLKEFGFVINYQIHKAIWPNYDGEV